jgi:hypothetical protein
MGGSAAPSGVTLEQAQARSWFNLLAHNAEETPLFAKDIERKALEDAG